MYKPSHDLNKVIKVCESILKPVTFCFQTTMTRAGLVIPKPPLLQLSSANIDRHGAYLMDVGNDLYLMVGGAISDQFCQDILDKPNFMSIPEGMVSVWLS